MEIIRYLGVGVRQSFFLLLVSALSSSAIAAPIEIDITRESGEIRGTVDFCGASDAGILVYIPGKSFSAFTDANGRYALSYVPEGTWTLAFERNGRRIGPTISGVVVVKRQATDVDLFAGNPNAPGPYVLCPDLDGDGFFADADCNDNNPRVNDDAPEFCGDGLDNDCNGLTDENCPECTDNDGDGFFAQLGCGFIDCDDSSASVSPGAAEVCDGIDNNCNNQVDEASALDASTFYLDADLDGFGGSTTVKACVPPQGYISVGGDCDESNKDVYPGATERCNLIDDNCDGAVDNECSNQVCADSEIAAFEQCMNGCGGDVQACALACFETLSEQCSAAMLQLSLCGFSSGCVNPDSTDPSPLAASLCLYDNCPDEWQPVFGNFVPTECGAGDTRPCGLDIGACQPGAQSCVNGRWAGECVGAVEPQPESCDGVDNDCDGSVDNGEVVDGQLLYYDRDRDGFGDPNASIQACPGGDNDGVLVANGNDCDDNDSSVRPGALEYCDGRDNNCDGQVDESDPNAGSQCQTGQAGVCGAGTRQCVNAQLACVQTTQPGPEYCDGLDNDCDGEVDNGDLADGQIFYFDEDQDGFGDWNYEILACPGTIPGVVSIGGDCNDTDSSINPNAIEVCDEWDNNCDGIWNESDPTEGSACNTGQPGVCAAGTLVCAGYDLVCDGNTAPGPEICDGIDNNCDGIVDENQTVPVEHGFWVCDGPLGNRLVCDSGFADCNDNHNDGCEKDLVTDTSNCGACGNVCPDSYSCNFGTCMPGQ